MNSSPGKVVTGVGLLLVVIIFFFLPWVVMAPLQQATPVLGPILTLLEPCLGELLKLAEQFSSLSGLELVFKTVYVPTPFRILVALPLIVGPSRCWIISLQRSKIAPVR